MDKLTFASVYRTAAILAAFSQASAASEERSRVTPCLDRTGTSVPHGLPCGSILSALLMGGFAMWRWLGTMMGRDALPSKFDRHPGPSWVPPHAGRRRASFETSNQQSIVSHFAFCDEPDGPAPYREP